MQKEWKKMTLMNDAPYDPDRHNPTYFVGGRRSGKTTWLVRWLKEDLDNRFIVVPSASWATQIAKEWDVGHVIPEISVDMMRGMHSMDYMVDEADYFDLYTLRRRLSQHKFVGGTLTANVITPKDVYV